MDNDGLQHFVLEGFGDRFRVISDGTSVGTYVFLDGKQLQNVTRIQWTADQDEPVCKLTLEMTGNPVELDLVSADTEVKDITPNGELFRFNKPNVADEAWEKPGFAVQRFRQCHPERPTGAQVSKIEEQRLMFTAATPSEAGDSEDTGTPTP